MNKRWKIIMCTTSILFYIVIYSFFFFSSDFKCTKLMTKIIIDSYYCDMKKQKTIMEMMWQAEKVRKIQLKNNLCKSMFSFHFVNVYPPEKLFFFFFLVFFYFADTLEFVKEIWLSVLCERENNKKKRRKEEIIQSKRRLSLNPIAALCAI